MAKGWVQISSNQLTNSKENYIEKSQKAKNWNKLMIEAEKYNDNLMNNVKSHKKKIQNEENTSSQAEELVEKKYKKDKTQIKIFPKAQNII